MAVYLSSGSGSVCIGVYSLANDKIAIIPQMVPEEKAKETANWLKVNLVYTSIANSILVGALACSNSNGIILPKMVTQEELYAIQSLFDGKIRIMDTKKRKFLIESLSERKKN